MRAITGAVVSSRPCPLPKAARVLVQFSDSAAASDLPSSDCATYLRVASEAVADHLHFRRELRRGLAALGCEVPAEGEEEPRHRLGRDDGDAAPVTAHGSAAEAELAAGGGGGEKSKKKKIKEEEDHRDDVAAVAGVASPEIAGEKRKKKEKHSSKDHEASVVKQEPDVVAKEEMGSQKKKDKKKKKKEKDHVKVEEQATDAMEVERNIVNHGAAGEGIAIGEKKRKKKKHEGNVKGLEEKGNLVVDVDLGSEKERKKKRGRGDGEDNALEQVEHTRKKQRKQS